MASVIEQIFDTRFNSPAGIRWKFCTYEQAKEIDSKRVMILEDHLDYLIVSAYTSMSSESCRPVGPVARVNKVAGNVLSSERRHAKGFKVFVDPSECNYLLEIFCREISECEAKIASVYTSEVEKQVLWRHRLDFLSKLQKHISGVKESFNNSLRRNDEI